jgi:hypothetical protein
MRLKGGRLPGLQSYKVVIICHYEGIHCSPLITGFG